MIESIATRALNWTRLRVLDADAALWRLRGRIHRMRSKPWPLFVVMAVVLTACAHRQDIRESASIRETCVRELDGLPSDADPSEVRAILTRCERAFDEVTDAD